MSTNRIARINELLRREIGEALFRIIKDEHFDLSAVTITRVITGGDLRNARVFVSIRNHKDEREHMMAVLRKIRPVIQKAINRDLILKYTPRLSFELDTSVEKGDELLHILAHLDDTDPQKTEEPNNSLES